MEKTNWEKETAKVLLQINAVGFSINKPITFKSGIKSPVYVDNRKLPFHPKEWKVVLSGFKDLIEKNHIEFDVIAGVEAGGIPHSAALGFLVEKPSVFVRKQAKEHGTKSRIEGGDVKNKKVLLIEDLISTGGSSLASIEALRNEGAIADDCIVIVRYNLPEAAENFEKAKVRVHALTPFPVILEEAIAMGKLSGEEAESVRNWLSDPHGWSAKISA